MLAAARSQWQQAVPIYGSAPTLVVETTALNIRRPSVVPVESVSADVPIPRPDGRPVDGSPRTAAKAVD